MNQKFNDLRKKYEEFVYKKYEIEELAQSYKITYFFEIKGLSKFKPSWTFKKNEKNIIDIKDSRFKKMVFDLGLVELISYWKMTCSPKVIIETGNLNEDSITWWKKQYFNGLGEFFYINKIDTNFKEFMSIEIKNSTKEEILNPINFELKGNLITVGGGKDSVVALELLKQYEQNSCYMINPRGANLYCSEIAGYAVEDIITAKRTLDENMLNLNKQGYLNGHTPFSAVVAFSALICAYINTKKYIILSNEASANESTIKDSNINHQYSKSFEFEKDFNEYEKKYISSGIKYFSILRPFLEIQIAKYFSKHEKYFGIFKSCNVGSKTNSWCANCPKCLFVYIILSPFIEQEVLTKIFNKNLFDDMNLLEYFNKLIGIEEEKPFECVGSREEANFAICKTIKNMEESNIEIPKLLKYYKTTKLYNEFYNKPNELLNYFNEENLIPDEFINDLKNQML